MQDNQTIDRQTIDRQIIDPRTINLDQDVIDAAMARGRYLRSQAFNNFFKALARGFSRLKNELLEQAAGPRAQQS
ncbi:MAG: hypothetical protein ACKVKG_08805 [Alphaproteobacteria bacterium]|jgi:hypothetical protein